MGYYEIQNTKKKKILAGHYAPLDMTCEIGLYSFGELLAKRKKRKQKRKVDIKMGHKIPDIISNPCLPPISRDHITSYLKSRKGEAPKQAKSRCACFRH